VKTKKPELSLTRLLTDKSLKRKRPLFIQTLILKMIYPEIDAENEI
jgi:hypothetical protein